MAVLDFITAVAIAVSEDIENGEDLPVVGDQGLADHVSAEDKFLDDFEHDCDDFRVSGVQGGWIKTKRYF